MLGAETGLEGDWVDSHLLPLQFIGVGDLHHLLLHADNAVVLQGNRVRRAATL